MNVALLLQALQFASETFALYQKAKREGREVTRAEVVELRRKLDAAFDDALTEADETITRHGG